MKKDIFKNLINEKNVFFFENEFESKINCNVIGREGGVSLLYFRFGH